MAAAPSNCSPPPPSPRDDTVQPLECSAVIATSAGLLPTRMMFALADRFPIRSMGPREMRDGKACERLELEDRDGARASAWFDAASGRLLEIRTQDRKPGAPPSILRIEAWTTVGQLTLPTTISARKGDCLLYTSPSPRDRQKSRMPSSA